MTDLFFDLIKGLLMGICFILICLILASVNSSAYSKDLSKSVSVIPQRHCGFIVPKFRLASQAVQKISASISAMQTRLYSLYEGMTRQNKVLPNMSGGSYRPRVNPLTIISQIVANLKTQNCKEASHA